MELELEENEEMDDDYNVQLDGYWRCRLPFIVAGNRLVVVRGDGDPHRHRRSSLRDGDPQPRVRPIVVAPHPC